MVSSRWCFKIMALSAFCYNHLKRYMPILRWLPRYTFQDLPCDFFAGITVGIMVIPQALAYASLADIPTTYGLYSSFMGSFLYCLFGTSKDITVGPTAIMSLLVKKYNVSECGEMAVIFSFYVGVILITMALFHLAFLVRFVSLPVISAFTSAAALTIACSQLNSLTGTQVTSQNFFINLVEVFKRIRHWNFYDFSLSAACITILFLLSLLSKLKPNHSISSTQIILHKILWISGISRNAFVLVLSCLFVFILKQLKIKNVLTLNSKIHQGIPHFTNPDFTPFCESKNATYTVTETISQFGGGFFIVPLVAFLEMIAVGKAFSHVNKYKIAPTQELFSLGMINMIGSFVSGFPVTGSFSRSSVNSQSGARTPLAGLFTGIVVLLSLQFLTPLFAFIPRACLSAIVISAVLPLCNFRILHSIWRIKRMDLLPYAVTFLFSFYMIELGLLLGIVFSIFLILYPVMNPKVEEEFKEVIVLRVCNGLFYPGIDHITDIIEEIIYKPNSPNTIMLDMHGVSNMDYTIIAGIVDLRNNILLVSPSKELIVTNLCDSLKPMFIMANLGDTLVESIDIFERYEEGQGLLTKR